MNNHDIQKILNEFLSNHSVDYPVDIFNLANQAGYQPFGFSPRTDEQLPKISGALDYERKRIFINNDENLNRQRFTCAHELGHALLHSQDIVDKKIAFRVEGESNNMEAQANHFAACLLMPEQYIKDLYPSLLQDFPIVIHRIEALAKLFQVSTQAMFYRLKNIELIK